MLITVVVFQQNKLNGILKQNLAKQASMDERENLIKKELEDATNIHLSADSIYRLVETYLEKRLGDETQYILGEGRVKTLRLNAENRRLLYDDFLKLPKQANPTYRTWEEYLNNSIPFEKITFDGSYAAEHNDVVFIMPTHPLVKQSLNCFEDEPVFVSLKAKSNSIEKGDYPFLIYEWLYKGVKPDNKLQVITAENISNQTILETIYNAIDGDMDPETINQESLEELHYQVWQSAKQKYKETAEQIVGYKKESLIISQTARVKTLKDRIAKVSDPKIIRMKQSQLASQERNFYDKLESLTKQIQQSDIITRKLVVGILTVEN